MPTFLHHPSNTIIETTSPAQAARYRRSSRFTELPNPSESSDTPTNAPHSPETPSPTPDTTDISKYTVAQVLAWVDNDPDRARQALQTEQAGRNRITLLRALRRYR